MEYIIIFLLLIILLILYYSKEINFIYHINKIKNNVNKNNLFNLSYFYKLKFLYYNPILINLYHSILNHIQIYS